MKSNDNFLKLIFVTAITAVSIHGGITYIQNVLFDVYDYLLSVLLPGQIAAPEVNIILCMTAAFTFLYISLHSAKN